MFIVWQQFLGNCCHAKLRTPPRHIPNAPVIGPVDLPGPAAVDRGQPVSLFTLLARLAGQTA